MRLRLKVSLRRNTERAKAQSALAESGSMATKGLVELRLSADARGAAKARGAFRLQSKKLRINTRGYYGRFRRKVGREAPKRCSPRGLATESPRLPCGKVDSAGDRRLRMGRLPCDNGDPELAFPALLRGTASFGIGNGAVRITPICCARGLPNRRKSAHRACCTPLAHACARWPRTPRVLR